MQVIFVQCGNKILGTSKIHNKKKTIFEHSMTIFFSLCHHSFSWSSVSFRISMPRIKEKIRSNEERDAEWVNYERMEENFMCDRTFLLWSGTLNSAKEQSTLLSNYLHAVAKYDSRTFRCSLPHN